jgi:hypothetical protein
VLVHSRFKHIDYLINLRQLLKFMRRVHIIFVFRFTLWVDVRTLRLFHI